MAKPTTRLDPEQVRKLAAQLPLGRDAAAVRRRIEGMEHLLEGLVTIPGLNRKVGLDVILDFIPVAGPTIAAAMGGWMMWEARNLGMTNTHMLRMAGNIGIDYLLGLVPWIGAVPDFFFRSNTRNLKMIKRFMDRNHPSTAIIQG